MNILPPPPHSPNAILRELERTRKLVIAAESLDDLHHAVDQSMRHALACGKEVSAPQDADKKYLENSLDGLIETLANICVTLLDSHEIPREQLLELLDAALAQHTAVVSCASH